MKSTFIFILFISIALIKSSQVPANDIESPILSVEERAQSHSYNQLRTEDDQESSDGGSSVEPVDNSWKIPRGQFDFGVPIYGTIFGFLTAWGDDDLISLLVGAIYIMSFAVCAQAYFGFYLSVHRRQFYCMFLPEIRYNKIDFGRSALDVSFGRWISGPFSWITEIISFLPPDAYKYLEDNAHFPKRSIIHLIFMVQLLYYFGVYDCYRSSLSTTAP